MRRGKRSGLGARATGSLLVALASLAALLGSGDCNGNGDLGDPGGGGGGGGGSKDEVAAQSEALHLRLRRQTDRFRIELSVPLKPYRNGPGMYAVFVRESALKRAVKLSGAGKDAVDRRSSGSYEERSGGRAALRALALFVDCAGWAAHGAAGAGVLELPGALTGVAPITHPSQLPEIALALGEKYVAAVGQANLASEPFRKLLKALSGGQPGILLVPGKVYWIDVIVRGSPKEMGLDVTVPYVHGPFLPSGLPMQQVLTPLVIGHEQFGRPIAFEKEVSASLEGTPTGGGEITPRLAARAAPDIIPKPLPRFDSPRTPAAARAEPDPHGFVGSWIIADAKPPEAGLLMTGPFTIVRSGGQYAVKQNVIIGEIKYPATLEGGQLIWKDPLSGAPRVFSRDGARLKLTWEFRKETVRIWYQPFKMDIKLPEIDLKLRP